MAARRGSAQRQGAAEVAYLRGDTYIWSSGDRLHVWVHDGDDGWAESGWAESRLSGASGVAVPQPLIDEFVVMRFAELLRQGLMAATIERALVAHRGNVGCAELAATHEQLVAAITRTTP